MRPVKVVVLVNLALALGVGWGYLWWGRRAEARIAELSREVVAARTSVAAGGEREYHGQGVVRAVLGELNLVVITHDEIPGYMPAMTMGFRAASPKIQEGVEVGDAVRFTLRGTLPNLVLVAIDKVTP
jgi:Cu/Ag efflux protein CusF